ncbi:MAG: 2-C-methyl-D-erythritol 4-phosphate cytidylyltransferase [Acidobacteriota bacterium]|nr:2-C-methyl-D-erythritol 4-phosphate cytidylyltransferase [Acidobacteriota bacterium]
MNIAIIPAAGSGTRVGGQISKQFLEIAGAPILVHTMQRFIECDDIGALAIALPADKLNEYRSRSQTVDVCKPVFYVSGGAERSDSILNALDAIAHLNPEIVAVHDAVRPFVSPAQISAVIARAQEVGAAILALPATDTIKEVENGLIQRTIDRRRVWRAQTPQAFRYDLLMRANLEAKAANLPSAMTTDDAMLVEQLGAPVAVIEGSPNNIKITTPEDLVLAEKLFEQMNAKSGKLPACR